MSRVRISIIDKHVAIRTVCGRDRERDTEAQREREREDLRGGQRT